MFQGFTYSKAFYFNSKIDSYFVQHLGLAFEAFVNYAADSLLATSLLAVPVKFSHVYCVSYQIDSIMGMNSSKWGLS